MEIKLLDKQKIFLEGIIRSCAFLVLIRTLSSFALNNIIYPIIEFISFQTSIFLESKSVFTSDEFAELLVVPIIFLVSYFLFILTTYILAKFCGINKYFSQFKFWKSLIFLIIISILAYCFCSLNLHAFKFNFIDKNQTGIIAISTIVPSYLIYLFFNFLTKNKTIQSKLLQNFSL